MDTLTFLRTIRALADGEEAFHAAIEGAAGFEPKAYADAVDRQRLLSWIEPAVTGAAGRRRLPAGLVAAVEAGSEARRERVREGIAQRIEIQDALDRAGIECRHLKGVYFGARFYGDPTRRHQRDTDVLVRSADRDRALEALEGLGYERLPGPISEGVVRWELRRGYATVDLHWNLRRRARRRIAEADLWDGSVPFEVGGRTLSAPADETTLLFLLLSLCGDLRRGACGARHLLDLHLLLRGVGGCVDPEAFLERRARQGLLLACVNVLAVFLALWDVTAELPAWVRAVQRRRRLVTIRDRRDALGLLERPRDSAESEAWFRRSYPYDRFGAWGRRLTLDLPFTLARLLPSRRFTLGAGRPVRPRAIASLDPAAAGGQRPTR